MLSSSVNVHFVVFSLKITSFDQTSKRSLWDEKIPFLLNFIFYKFPQKFIFFENKGIQPAIGALVLELISMLLTHYLIASNATDRFLAPLIANDTGISRGKLKIRRCDILQLGQLGIGWQLWPTLYKHLV